MADDVLLYGDTERSAALRHEIPLAIGDPFLYVEVDGRRVVLTNALERDRIAARRCPTSSSSLADELGLRRAARERACRATRSLLELVARGCARGSASRDGGRRRRSFPSRSPTACAPTASSCVDHEPFDGRRRAKNAAELAGIRRAQGAAEAGMAARGRAAARGASRRDGELRRRRRAAARRARPRRDPRRLRRRTAPPPRPTSSSPRAPGRRPRARHGPAARRTCRSTIDLWPRDEASGCWADMTRTFVVGELDRRGRARMHGARAEALEAAARGRAPGRHRPRALRHRLRRLRGRRPPDAAHRRRARRSTEGFYFSLGHGVGLEVHEAPGLGPAGHEPLVAGDVSPSSRACGSAAIGGVRFEDLLLVTDDGGETLTDYPYDLTP